MINLWKKAIIIIFSLIAVTTLVLVFSNVRGERKNDSNPKGLPFSMESLFPGYATTTLFISEKRIFVAVADSPGKTSLGLGGISALPEDFGMFFIFSRSDLYPFWMKGMKIPIDIIWISDEYKIVFIKERVIPESFPESFWPSEKARFVLEVNAGFSEKNNLFVGEEVKIENF